MEQKNMPVVSIVVPIYNVEKYLRECLESLVSQTYQMLEILLIDDGSTDSCGEIAQEFVQKDARVQYYYKQNGGLSDARNYGIERATGEFLLFVDSDDWLEPFAVETLVEAQQRYETRIVIANFHQFDEGDGLFYFRALEQDYQEKLYQRQEFLQSLALLENQNPTFITSWGILFDRTLFNHVRFPFGRLCEDIGTNYKLFDQCESILYIHKGLYWYRVRPNSIWTSDKSEKIIRDDYELRTERIAYLALRGIDVSAYREQQLWKIKEEWLPRCQEREYFSIRQTLQEAYVLLS